MLSNIIIVNYNNSQCTIDLISSLVSSSQYVNKVIVIDNNSSSEEVSLLKVGVRNYYSIEVRLIESNVNVGYFPALNLGIATLSNDDKSNCMTIIGNNDLVFNQDFFTILTSKEYDKNTIAISPSIITSDGVYQNPAQVNKPSRLKRCFYRIYFSNYYIGSLILKIWIALGFSAQSKIKKDLHSKKIYIGMGAIYILRPEFFNFYDKLNYPFFLYGEEAFLSQQILDVKRELFYDSEIEVLHLESVATNKLPSQNKYSLMKKAYSVYRHFFK
ncbi:glycosyltransferase family 2 protein [Vibrio artabrorum]|uniref:glycosyltransferase family 2 protein n=1 Tax=Vibrio artabrorum TaxID=446374 RepID=UPI00354BE1A2